MLPRSDRSRAAWVVAGVTLPLYLATMSRTIGYIDRGELAAVAWTFGIAHAPGYPTLMLLAGALAHVVPLRPVLTLNALAAVLVAAGAAVLVLLLDRVLAALSPAMSPRVRAMIAAASALFTATTMTWWQQANGFEVYALHALLMPLTAWLALRWIEAEPRDARSTGVAFGLVTGLSFTNHLTTGLLAPGLILVAIARLGIGRTFWSRVAWLIGPFVLGLLPYAWLPIRSSMQPRFDWGNPETLRAFLHHVTARDYHNRLFSDLASVEAQARYLLWRLPWDYAWIGIVLAGLGAVLLARRARTHGLMAASFVVAGFTFAAGYRIVDIDSYLMTIALGIAVCFAGGLVWCVERLGGRRTAAVALVLVALNTSLHWRDCDERGNRLAEGFTRDALGPLPPNAVLISRAWDYGISASLYFQEVEGFRRDVLVVITDLTHVGWYLDELERRAPELLAGSGEAFHSYRRMLRAVDAGAARGPEVEMARRRFVAAFVVAAAMRDQPVFITEPLPGTPESWQEIPFHIVSWLRPDRVQVVDPSHPGVPRTVSWSHADSAYVQEPEHAYAFRPWPGHADFYTAKLCWGYAVTRIARARYEYVHGHGAEAQAIAESVRRFDPQIRPEAVGPLPVGQDSTVLAAARYFRELEEWLASR